MESGKEAAANVGASARAGMEKTRAAVQGQVDKVAAYTTGDREAAEVNREAAKVRMQQRVHAAEEDKQRALSQNAAAKERAAAGKDTEDHHHAAGKEDKETETEMGTEDHRHRPAIGGVVEE